MTEELESCPFPHEIPETNLIITNVHRWFNVTCDICDAEGPMKDTEAEAIAAWNAGRCETKTAKGWYVVQDADWDWDQEDGPGMLIEAGSPEEAAKIAFEKCDCDGVTFMIAPLGSTKLVEFPIPPETKP